MLRHDDESPLRGLSPSWSGGDGAGRLKIGLIESSSAVREALKKWLDYAGIGEIVATASSLKEALESWGPVTVEAILLEMRRPREHSSESIVSFREKYAGSRIILMSHHDLESEKKSVPSGIDACLSKAELTDRLVPTLIQLFPDRRIFA